MSKVATMDKPRSKQTGRYFTPRGWEGVFDEQQYLAAVEKHFTEDDTRSRLVASIILEELRKGA